MGNKIKICCAVVVIILSYGYILSRLSLANKLEAESISYKLKWQEIGQQLYRIPVQEGWAVRFADTTMIFVPDENHVWNPHDKELRKWWGKEYKK